MLGGQITWSAFKEAKDEKVQKFHAKQIAFYWDKLSILSVAVRIEERKKENTKEWRKLIEIGYLYNFRASHYWFFHLHTPSVFDDGNKS